MKKIICLFLATLLLLSGCSNVPAPEETTEPAFMATCPPVPEYTGSTDEEVLQWRRDVVEQSMRYMTTVRWTLPYDVMYSLNSKSKGPEYDLQTNPNDVVTLVGGRIYEGIPYTHASGSPYSFISFATEQKEDGTLVIPSFSTALFNGWGTLPERHGRLGTDCADQVFWAWSRIATSITFNLTVNMTEKFGCLKVGDYVYEGEQNLDTKGACKENGIQRMCEAYALLQKGDAIVHCQNSGGGHAQMIVSVHVVRNEEGLIDPVNSYAITLEQSSGCEREQSDFYIDETTGEKIYQLEVPDRKYTFFDLFSSGYLPITCKELIDPSPLEEPVIQDSFSGTVTPSLENMFQGIVSCNYRIDSTTITITDENGKEVQKSTMFCMNNEIESMDLSRYLNPIEQDVLQGLVDPNYLESGTYTVTYTARIATGEELTFRTFTFTK